MDGSDGEDGGQEEREEVTGIGREILWGPDGPIARGGFLTSPIPLFYMYRICI